MVICHPNIYVLMSTQCASPTPCEQSMATTGTPESEPCLIPASPIKTISRSPLQLWLSFDYLVPSNSLSGTTSSDQPIRPGECWVAETFPLRFVPRLPTYQVEATSHRIESEALLSSSIWSTNCYCYILASSFSLGHVLSATRNFSHLKTSLNNRLVASYSLFRLITTMPPLTTTLIPIHHYLRITTNSLLLQHGFQCSRRIYIRCQEYY